MTTEFAVGDHVWIAGNPSARSVQWVITSINQAAIDRIYATVRSPMSCRSRVVPIGSLTLHSRGGAK